MLNILTTALFSWLLTYTAGWILWLPFSGQRKPGADAVFFFRMALGFIGLTTATALYYTGGITVLSGVVVLYALACKPFRVGKLNVRFGEAWKFAAAGLTILFLTIGFQFIRNKYFDPGLIWLSYCDYGVYATMIEYLPKTGVEVSWPWYELIDVSARGLVQPYHYADSWYAVFINALSGGSNALEVYIYCFIPVLVSIGFSGFLALYRVVAGPKGALGWPELLVAFSGVFLHGCLAPAFKFFHAHSLNILTSPKVALLTIPLAMVWILWLQGLRRHAVLVAAFIPLANILYAPVILPVFFLMIAVGLKWNKDTITCMSVLVLTAAFIVAFYGLSGNFDTSSDPVAMRGGHSYGYWFLRRMTATPVRHFISYFPLYLVFGLLFFKIKKIRPNEKEVAVSAILLLFFATLVAAIMNAYSENFQFHLLTYNPVSQLGLVFGLGLMMKFGLAGWREKLVVGVVFFHALIAFILLFTTLHQRDSAVDKAFAGRVSYLLKNKNPIGLYVQNPALTTTYSADPRMCYMCNLLKVTGPGRWANDMAAPDNLERLPFPERRTAIANSPFFRFLSDQKAAGKYDNYADAQLQLIDRYGVDYVLVESGAEAPRGVLSCTDTMIVEPYTGTQLFMLKRPCAFSSLQPPTTPR